MSDTGATENHRILVIDDNPAIQEDFRKILMPQKIPVEDLQEVEMAIFGASTEKTSTQRFPFEIDSAYQGQEGLQCVTQALLEGRPYAMAFVDIRMPPGWDGIETIKEIWKVDPAIQMAICSAYSDYAWDNITTILGKTDRLLILKKPFDVVEISQMALALTKKWNLNRQVQDQVDTLNILVKKRTQSLEEALTTLRFRDRAMEASADGIIIFNAQHPGFPLLYVNPAFERITGYLASEVMGKNFLFLQGQDRDQPELGQLLKALETAQEGKAVLRNYRKDGSLFWNEIHIAPITDSKGIATHFVAILIDITSQKHMSDQLTYQATHDLLTGLPNRSLLLEHLNQAIGYAKRYGVLIAVLFLDLDHFKLVNDSLGHNAGDRLLQQLTIRVRSLLRESDMFVRLGGDEFVVVIPSLAKEEDFLTVAKKIQKEISAPFQIANRELSVTCSTGVALYPKHGHDSTVLLKNADAALCYAKEVGRNNVQLYTPEMNSASMRRLELENDLSKALEQHQFLLHYQPLLELKTNNIIGMEALIRWSHPKLGLIPPLDFINIAESNGQIIPMGEWVLRTACAQNKAWQKQGFKPIKIAVNLSWYQLNQPDIVEKIASILREIKLEPIYLELELTENTIMRNTTEALTKMFALKKIGVSLVIDDFGTGYSSLSYLKQFPIDKIKIDQSFIRDITTNAHDIAIVDAIIAMAVNLKMRVVAEGVETESQLKFLRNHHSDEVQGYYFSCPVSSEEATKLLKFKPA